MKEYYYIKYKDLSQDINDYTDQIKKLIKEDKIAFFGSYLYLRNYTFVYISYVFLNELRKRGEPEEEYSYASKEEIRLFELHKKLNKI